MTSSRYPDIIKVKGSPSINDKDRLIQRYEDEIAHLREERDEYKNLLFRKVGLKSDETKVEIDTNTLKPIGRNKVWSERVRDLERQHKEKARQGRES